MSIFKFFIDSAKMKLAICSCHHADVNTSTELGTSMPSVTHVISIIPQGRIAIDGTALHNVTRSVSVVAKFSR